VTWSDHLEAFPIERDDEISVDPFGESDDRCVRAAELEIGVPLDRVGDAVHS